jgi:hypothetical protein
MDLLDNSFLSFAVFLFFTLVPFLFVLASCSSSRSVQVQGRGSVIIQDTTFIDHSSDYFRNFKYMY